MSPFDPSRHLTLCRPCGATELPPPRVIRHGEPSTHRMRADEVRAFLQRIERPHAHDAAVGSEPPVDGEPPTLVYRGRGRRARSGPREAAEPRTLHGLGPRLVRAIVAIPGGALTPSAKSGEGSVDWFDASDEVETIGERVFVTDEGATTSAATYAELVDSPAPSFGPRARGGPDTVDAHDAPARQRSKTCALALDAAQAERRARLARRTKWLGLLLLALLALSPLLLGIVRWASQPDVPASEPPASSAPRSELPHSADQWPNAPSSELPAALQASARALDGRAGADASARARAEALHRAVEQLLAGETREALLGFRVLARSEPGVPMLGRVVRLLEQQLQACASEGGDACR